MTRKESCIYKCQRTEQLCVSNTNRSNTQTGVCTINWETTPKHHLSPSGNVSKLPPHSLFIQRLSHSARCSQWHICTIHSSHHSFTHNTLLCIQLWDWTWLYFIWILRGGVSEERGRGVPLCLGAFQHRNLLKPDGWGFVFNVMFCE